MNDTKENKVDSLIAELRSFGDRPPPRFAWKRLADELESAVNEERNMWQHLQDTTVKMLEHEKAEANRRVEEIAAQATSKMLEGATIIDNRGQGNTAAMREALTNLTCFEESDIRQLEQLAKRAIDNDIYGGGILQSLCEAIREGKAALSVTPRQCDVGSADEKLKRWRKYCENFHYCVDCPVNKKDGISADCFANWSQMPYEE